ncbi:MAG: D-glycerate dehydrogenase [Candidatus Paceibacterota bacterium]|jgi:glyoxylate reductase
MKKVYITRKLPPIAEELLRGNGYEVDVSGKDGVLAKEELITALKQKEYDAVLPLLTDAINGEIFDAAPKAKIFANYAVGFNNVDIGEAKKRGIIITNTPDVLTDTVAEHTFALIMSLASRIVEGDRFMRAGKYDGWAPLMLLGTDIKGKTLGILGTGRIGSRVAHMASLGFGMNIIYYDVSRNQKLEDDYGAKFRGSVDDVLREADVVSIHVPLLPTTRHLINKERLEMMKHTALLVNTSRGPVIDEAALVEALREGMIAGAAIDVYENEPKAAPGMSELENIIMTPHIASATLEARSQMAEVAAKNIIAVLEGGAPLNPVKG